MSCTDYRPALSEFADGLLVGDARTRIEEHVAGCAACRAVVADLKRIREAAGTLPAMPPPDALWSKVSAALDAEVDATRTAVGTPAPAAQPRRQAAPATGRWWRVTAWRRPAWVAAAAAAVVALAVGGTLFLRARPATVAAPATAAAKAASDVETVEAELDAADQHYSKAIAALEQAAREGRSALDPQTVAALDKSNVVLDQAIRDSRAAVKAQPTSELARTTLFDALERKVGLLRDTIALVNEMRKGNQAGAATIVGTMGKPS